MHHFYDAFLIIDTILRKGTMYHLVKIGAGGSWKVISACGEDIPHGDLLLATNEINQAAIVFDKTSIMIFRVGLRVCHPELKALAEHRLHAPPNTRTPNIWDITLRVTKSLASQFARMLSAPPNTSTAYIWDIQYIVLPTGTGLGKSLLVRHLNAYFQERHLSRTSRVPR